MLLTTRYANLLQHCEILMVALQRKSQALGMAARNLLVKRSTPVAAPRLQSLSVHCHTNASMTGRVLFTILVLARPLLRVTGRQPASTAVITCVNLPFIFRLISSRSDSMHAAITCESNLALQLLYLVGS